MTKKIEMKLAPDGGILIIRDGDVRHVKKEILGDDLEMWVKVINNAIDQIKYRK